MDTGGIGGWYVPSTSHANGLLDGSPGTALALSTSARITLNEELKMKKGIVTLIMAATAAFAAGPTQTFTGVITDSMCGKSHKAMGVTPDSKCVRDCVHADPSRYKYSLSDGKNVYVLSDQQTPERFAGQKVNVKGVLDQKTHTIRVDTMVAAK